MKSKNYIGICVSLIFIIIMFILRFWTDIERQNFYLQNYLYNYVHVITFCHLEVL